MQSDQLIIFENVSKFYGEVLGVNRVTLAIAPGVTSLVGPNGAGKTTLLEIIEGLRQPDRANLQTAELAEKLRELLNY